MPVSWNGAPLCQVNGAGGIRYRGETARNPLTETALERAADIVYMTPKRECHMDGILEQIRGCVPDLDTMIAREENMDGQIADLGQSLQAM